jgi:hypothetical protein
MLSRAFPRESRMTVCMEFWPNASEIRELLRDLIRDIYGLPRSFRGFLRPIQLSPVERKPAQENSFVAVRERTRHHRASKMTPGKSKTTIGLIICLAVFYSREFKP